MLKQLHNKIHVFATLRGLTPDCISTGNPDAEIAIVSDYPGKTEVDLKVPLSGVVGRQFWSFCQKYHLPLNKQNCYITNALKTLLGRGCSTQFIDEQAAWIEVLYYELSQLPNLKYILVMGAQASDLFLHKYGLSEWRGSVIHFDNHPWLAMPTYNPAFVWQKNEMTGDVKDPILEVVFRLDCAKFVRMTKGQYVPHDITPQIVCNMNDVNDMFADLVKSTAEDNPIGSDIEHWNKQTACIGFSTEDNTAWVLPFCDTEKSLWTVEEECEIRLRLQQFFDHHKPKLVGQNWMTDATWLWYKDRIRPSPQYIDCMLAHHLLYSLMPHSLAFLVSQYTWHPYYKDEGTTWRENGDILQYWGYNAKDAALQRYIGIHKLLPELRSRGLAKFFFEHVMPTDTEVIRATALGLQTDAKRIAYHDVEYTRRINEKTAALTADIEKRVDMEAFVRIHKRNMFDAMRRRTVNKHEPTDARIILDKFDAKLKEREIKLNLNSPPMMNSLFEAMGLPDAGRSTDKFQLNRWINSPYVSQEKTKIIRDIIALRADSKFYSTYVKVRIDEDGRCRFQLNQTGTRSAPGRFSGSQNMWGTGTNIQNQAGLARSQFIADADPALLYTDGYEHSGFRCTDYDPYVFVYIDGEQAEARYVGWCAEIDRWIEEFEYARLNPGKFDCHRALASRIYNVPYDQVPKDDHDGAGEPTIRWLAKRAKHGMNYRMMPPTFAEKTGVSVGTAEFVYTEYHKDTPELRKWWSGLESDVQTALRKTGAYILPNAYGRELVLLGSYTRSLTESIVAFEPQSSIGDWMKYVWLASHADDEWDHTKARMAFNVHDANVAISRLSFAKTALRIMIKHAETPMMVRGKPLIIPASGMISEPDEYGIHRWSGLRKVKL